MSKSSRTERIKITRAAMKAKKQDIPQEDIDLVLKENHSRRECCRKNPKVAPSTLLKNERLQKTRAAMKANKQDIPHEDLDLVKHDNEKSRIRSKKRHERIKKAKAAKKANELDIPQEYLDLVKSENERVIRVRAGEKPNRDMPLGCE